MRKKLLEEHLRTSEQELQQCRDKIADLEKQLEEYRQKEQAIAAALTQAQTSAAALILEARGQVKNIYDEADQTREQIQKEAEEAHAQAQAQADEIVAQARESAVHLIDDAKEQAAQISAAAVALEAVLSQSAASARTSAEGFIACCEGEIEVVKDALARLAEETATYTPDPDAAVPDHYESPAELIHSIYKLQGRSAPEQADEAQGEQDKLWTVEEVVQDAQTEADLPDQELDAIIDDVLKGD